MIIYIKTSEVQVGPTCKTSFIIFELELQLLTSTKSDRLDDFHGFFRRTRSLRVSKKYQVIT